MGLPTSGFPKLSASLFFLQYLRFFFLQTLTTSAIMMEIPGTGQRYLRVSHFLTRGIPASLISFVIIVTIGYALMSIAGL
jgi:phosphate transporter